MALPETAPCGIGNMPLPAAAKMTTTARSAPPRAPAMIVVSSRILSSSLLLLLGLRPRSAQDIVRPLPVWRALGEVAPGAGGELARLRHCPGSIIGFGGGKIGHRRILEIAVGLGGLIPGKNIVIFHQ